MLNDQVRSEEDELPARRNESQRAVGEADVPVGLRARRHGGGVVGAVVPDRVDREQRRDQHDHAERDEEEPAHLRHVDRHHRVAHDVAVRAAGAGELRVLVDHHQHEVHHEQADEDRGQQQDVERVEAADDRDARELAAEQQERGPRADQRDALDHAVDDAEAVARQQVVGQRVAGEALAHRQDEQDEADHPVELARLAEGAREEDAQHVHADARDEDERGPVVDLTDEQTAADVERDRQRRIERRRHLDAAHREERAGVVRGHHRRLEEERQERAREQDDDEAPQRDLAEHERPVVGEDLATELLDEARRGSCARRCSSRWRRGIVPPSGPPFLPVGRVVRSSWTAGSLGEVLRGVS